MSTTPDLSRLRMPPPPLEGVPSLDDMRDAIDAAANGAGAVEDPALKNPKLQREYTFEFKFDRGGVDYSGTFRNRILNVHDRLSANALFSELLHGKPVASCHSTAVQLAGAISWLTYSLDKKTRPSWAANLLAVDDEDAIFALWGEVWSHQTTFLGRTDEAQPAAQKS